MTKKGLLRDNYGKTKRTRKMNGKIQNMIDFESTQKTVGGYSVRNLSFNDRMNRWIGEFSKDSVNWSFCLWSVEGECCRTSQNKKGEMNLI